MTRQPLHVQFPDWVEVWETRADDFNAAVERFPRARWRERDTFLDDLGVRAGDVFLDVAAAGGYLLRGVRARLGDTVRILAVEPSEMHLAALPEYVEVVPGATITRFTLDDASVDCVANLSGLHHTEDIRPYFVESFRVLRPGGRIGAADVRKGSTVDTWLNKVVDRYNEQGHVGHFYDEGEFAAFMRDAGFVEVVERTAHYTWDFDTVVDMAVFCKQLFDMRGIEPRQVAELIDSTLGIIDLPGGGVGMKWELIQAYGRKPV